MGLLCLLLGAAIGIGCWNLAAVLTEGRKDSASDEILSVPVGSADHERLAELAFAAAACLQTGDYEKLGAYTHPVYGLIFSPTATVTLSTNRCLTAARTACLDRDETVYIWGVVTGSDEPIQLTPAQYVAAYVYDRDYRSAPILSFDTPARTGNALENTAAVFPEAHYVDLCFPASEAGGLDWSILRMVFEEYDGEFRLTALIHSTYSE